MLNRFFNSFVSFSFLFCFLPSPPHILFYFYFIYFWVGGREGGRWSLYITSTETECKCAFVILLLPSIMECITMRTPETRQIRLHSDAQMPEVIC